MDFDLVNIIDLIVPDEESFLNEEESIEIYDNCLHIMEEFIKRNPTIISDPDFEDIFDDNIKELMESIFETDVFYTDDAEEEIEEIVEQAKIDFFKDFMPIRSYPDSVILEEPDYEYVEEQIALLKSKPQPAQRTKEWYEFRHNLITASNAYKAFDSQSTQNQLIYEKCQPNPSSNEDNDTKVIQVQMVNVNSSLHHGQKYEPLSVMIYEDTYKTRVDDFGCIQHEKYAFLGASPDGINVDRDSLRYGRMLEIKNIVNREIDGIPKKEYWIQMQLQMEVCDLDECDFLETKFTEYENADAFWSDAMSDKRKGVIAYFHTKDGKPYYVYKPLECKKQTDIDEWENNTLETYENEPYNYIYIKTIYWKLEVLSCILVLRDRIWFKNNIGQLGDVWKIVEKERITGYEHRAPKKRKMEYYAKPFIEKETQGCLLKFNKIIKVDTDHL